MTRLPRLEYRIARLFLLLAALWLGLTWGSAGLAAETAAAGADFEQGLAKCLALEQAGDFASAIQACNDLAAKFATHPDAGKVQKLLAKLKPEKRAALQLTFAVEKLASDTTEDRQVAHDQLLETPEVGAILLRQNIRKGSAKGVLATIDILQEIGDAKAIVAYADRLKGEPAGPLSDALIQAIEDRMPSTGPQERVALGESLGALTDVVKNDSVLERRDLASLLLHILGTWFEGQTHAFDDFLNKPGAFDTLTDYVKRVGAAPKIETAVWAFSQFAAVGLANTGGLVGWWKLDEQDGDTARDSSTNHLNGSLRGGPAWCHDALFRALRFDGADNQVLTKYLNVYPDITNTFTMTLWAYPTTGRTATPESNANADGTQGQRYTIYPTHGDVYGKGHAGAGISIGTNGVSVVEHAASYMPALAVYNGTLTNWTHVAVVYENRQPRIWVNGMLAKTGLVSTMTVHPGQNLGGSGSYGCFAGMLSDVRIYNRALTDKELATLGACGASTTDRPGTAAPAGK